MLPEGILPECCRQPDKLGTLYLDQMSLVYRSWRGTAVFHNARAASARPSTLCRAGVTLGKCDAAGHRAGVDIHSERFAAYPAHRCKTSLFFRLTELRFGARSSLEHPHRINKMCLMSKNKRRRCLEEGRANVVRSLKHRPDLNIRVESCRLWKRNNRTIFVSCVTTKSHQEGLALLGGTAVYTPAPLLLGCNNIMI